MNSIIAGKTVLIIGPGKSDGTICEDDFDIIVRFNILSEKSIINKKTDLIYYNKPVYKNFRQEINKLLKLINAVPIFTIEKFTVETNHLRSRLQIPGVKPFLTTNRGFHGVQRALWDILLFSPKSIKVINTSFFVADYDEDYLSCNKKDLKGYQVRKSVGHSHDPIQSFMFTKILYTQGLLTFDKIGERVINMSNKEYKDFIVNLNKEGQAKT
jgi:hypothetical protein